MTEPIKSRFVGGPLCGGPVKLPPYASTGDLPWAWHMQDPLRNTQHTYERRSPTDPHYYHKATIQAPSILKRPKA